MYSVFIHPASPRCLCHFYFYPFSISDVIAHVFCLFKTSTKMAITRILINGFNVHYKNNILYVYVNLASKKSFNPTHIFLQHFRHTNTAISLLIIFQYRNQRTTYR